MEATVSCGDNDLLLGNVDKFVNTITSIRAPVLGGKNIDIIARSRRAVVLRTAEKFRKLPLSTKERFVDQLVELFSWDLTVERASNLWNEILSLKEVGETLRALDSEFKNSFDDRQKIAIEKESIGKVIDDLGEIESALERCVVDDAEKLTEDVLVSVQTIHMCRLVLARALDYIDKKNSIDKRAIRVLLAVLISLARLSSYSRRKVGMYLIYDDLAVLSHMLMDENEEVLLESMEDWVSHRE
jgi:hypothetical protein